MAGGGKDNIQSIKQEVPKFLQEFKARAGLKESPSIESKCKELMKDEDNTVRDDEAPLVTLPDSLTEEEARQFLKNKFGNNVNIDSNKKFEGTDTSYNEENDGKLTFKKPLKRKEENSDAKKKKKKSKMDKVKNTKLLSFGDFEEDDET